MPSGWGGEALSIYRKVGHLDGQLTTSFKQGRIYYARSDWMAAFRAYREAWSIAVSLGDRHEEAESIDDLGKVARGAGATELANRLLDIALVRGPHLAAKGSPQDTPEALDRAGVAGGTGDERLEDGPNPHPTAHGADEVDDVREIIDSLAAYLAAPTEDEEGVTSE